jgi:ribosomal protein S8
MNNDTFGEKDSLFLELINKKIVTKIEEKKYISDITELKTIKLINCDSMNIHYKDFIDGKQIEFKLSLKEFKNKNHKIKYRVKEKGFQDCESIDGKEPWGGIYGHPRTEIDR